MSGPVIQDKDAATPPFKVQQQEPVGLVCSAAKDYAIVVTSQITDYNSQTRAGVEDGPSTRLWVRDL